MLRSYWLAPVEPSSHTCPGYFAWTSRELVPGSSHPRGAAGCLATRKANRTVAVSHTLSSQDQAEAAPPDPHPAPNGTLLWLLSCPSQVSPGITSLMNPGPRSACADLGHQGRLPAGSSRGGSEGAEREKEKRQRKMPGQRTAGANTQGQIAFKRQKELAGASGAGVRGIQAEWSGARGSGAILHRTPKSSWRNWLSEGNGKPQKQGWDTMRFGFWKDQHGRWTRSRLEGARWR